MERDDRIRFCHMPRATIQSVSLQDYDPDRLSAVVNGTRLDHAILGTGKCSARLQRMVTPSMNIDSGHYGFPVSVQGGFPPSRICFGVSWGSRAVAWANGCDLVRGSLQVYPEGTDLLYRAHADSGWVVISIDRKELQTSARTHLGRELALPTTGFWNLPAPMSLVARFLKLVHCRHAGSVLEGASAAIFDSRLRLALVEVLGSGDADQAAEIERAVQHRAGIVRRGAQVIRRLVEDRRGYSSQELCRILGVSERNLQLHFKQSLGISPKAWFRRQSLNLVRSELLRTGPQGRTVTEVAVDFGFNHLGRFAGDYRKLFGESPSRTRQNGSRRSP